LCMSGSFQRGVAREEAGITLLDALDPEDRDHLASITTTVDPLDAQNGRGDLVLALGTCGRFADALALGEQLVRLPPSETFGSRGDAYYGLGYAYTGLGQPEAARQAFRDAREVFRDNNHRSMVMS